MPEEEARKLDLRPLLAVAAVLAVIATLWAAGAFASGGSPRSSDSQPDANAAFVQDQEGERPRSDEDCPERGGGRAPGTPEEGSGGSGAPEL